MGAFYATPGSKPGATFLKKAGSSRLVRLLAIYFGVVHRACSSFVAGCFERPAANTHTTFRDTKDCNPLFSNLLDRISKQGYLVNNETGLILELVVIHGLFL